MLLQAPRSPVQAELQRSKVDISALNSPSRIDRIALGEGHIREHSFEIGNTIIMLSNIGSMTIVEEKIEYWTAVLGFLILLFGVLAFGSSKSLSISLILGGFALLAWWFFRRRDVFLSIGTCDGRRTHIVSKDRDFLLALCKFIREKIDLNSSQTGSIDLDAATLSWRIDGD
jgi:hypothetical protein